MVSKWRKGRLTIRDGGMKIISPLEYYDNDNHFDQEIIPVGGYPRPSTTTGKIKKKLHRV